MGFVQTDGSWWATCDEPSPCQSRTRISGFDVVSIQENGLIPVDFPPGWKVGKLTKDLPLLDGYQVGKAVIACPNHHAWFAEVTS